MFALLRSRWLLLTVVLPLGIWAMDRIGATIENRHGVETSVSRALRKPREIRQGRRGKPQPAAA